MKGKDLKFLAIVILALGAVALMGLAQTKAGKSPAAAHLAALRG